MDVNPFLDRARPPEPAELTRALGRAMERWQRLRERLDAEVGTLTERWSYSGASYGWSLRLLRGKRAALYLLPRERGFLAAFALGEKACAAARAAGLREALLARVEGAPRYPEGRAVRFEVRTARDEADVLALTVLKLAH